MRGYMTWLNQIKIIFNCPHNSGKAIHFPDGCVNVIGCALGPQLKKDWISVVFEWH